MPTEHLVRVLHMKLMTSSSHTQNHDHDTTAPHASRLDRLGAAHRTTATPTAPPETLRRTFRAAPPVAAAPRLGSRGVPWNNTNDRSRPDSSPSGGHREADCTQPGGAARTLAQGPRGRSRRGSRLGSEGQGREANDCRGVPLAARCGDRRFSKISPSALAPAVVAANTFPLASEGGSSRGVGPRCSSALPGRGVDLRARGASAAAAPAAAGPGGQEQQEGRPALHEGG